MLAAVSGPITPAEPDFDAAAAYPEVAWIRDTAKARDWPSLSIYFERNVDPAGHWFVARTVAEAADREFLESIATNETATTLPITLLAIRLISDGWEIRTGAWGSDVSAERAKGFQDHLNGAEQFLIEATAREPHNTSAWCARLDTARGLSLGQAEARRRYDRLTRHAPHHTPAQGKMIQQLCPKWGGSYDAMHGFARQCAQASPPGSLNASMVAEAHIEHWLLEDRDKERDNGTDAPSPYLAQHPVQQETMEAARHSVLNPAFQLVPGWVNAHSAFAMVFSLAGNYTAAARHFRAMGNLGCEWPWMYWSEPEQTFAKHRDRALARG